MTPFVAVTAVSVKLIVSIESLTTETTLGVTLETTLIKSSRNIITVLFVLAQLGNSKKLVLMGEDFLVSSAQIAIMPRQVVSF
jgi:hypothetical protein